MSQYGRTSSAPAALLEDIQRAVARLLATTPPGHNLRLIGGFRYRFLNQSARVSRDIDYHWDGNLEEKQADLVSLFARRLLPDIKRRLGYEGDVRPAAGPGAESPAVRAIELVFWRPGAVPDRIELPVEITRIVCLDPPTVRTASGVVYPTASDADLIEAKVIAVLNREVVEHRDFCDIFLFTNHLAPNAAERLQIKLARISLSPDALSRRLRHLQEARDYHVRSIAAVVAEQLDPAAAASIDASGGAALVYDTVMGVLARLNVLGGKP